MLPSFDSRRRLFGRDALPGIAALAIVGAGGLLVHRAAPVLAAPVQCPGVLDLSVIWLARLSPNLRLGDWLSWTDRGLLIAGLIGFTIAARRACGHWIIAAAAGVALACLPAFRPTLAPFPSAGLVSASLAFLALGAASSHDRSQTSTRLWRAAWTWGALLAVAAVAPALAVPLGIVAGASARTAFPRARDRWVAGTAAGVLLVAGVAAIVALVPRLPPSIGPSSTHGCMVSALTGVSPGGVREVVAHLLSPAGALASALALLGAFVARRSIKPSAWPMMAYALAPIVLFTHGGVDELRTIYPALVVLWVLVAIGLAEAVRACGQTRGGRMGAAFLVALTPIVHVLGANRAAAAPDRFGHGRLSREDMEKIVAIVPDRSILVREDAVTDVLLRSLDGTWQKTGKTLWVAARDPLRLAPELAAGTSLFAMPDASLDLQDEGFSFESTQIPGLSRVRSTESCGPLAAKWRDVPDLAQSSAIALAAYGPDDDGPIVMYLAFEQPPDPRPLDWPAPARRGFYATAYDAAGADRAALDQDAHDDDLPAAWLAAGPRHVLRLELWRTPDEPERLAVALGAAPARSLARITGATPPGHLSLCPAFPYAPRPFGS